MRNSLIFKILRTVKYWFLGSCSNLVYDLKQVTEEHIEEKRLNINTSGGFTLKQDLSTFKDNRGVGSLPYHVVKEILNKILFSTDDVFVDLGCAKGRLVFAVATKRIKKAIGVEIVNEVYDIALNNSKICKGMNSDVEIINQDATIYDLHEPTVVFIYRSFGIKTFNKIMENLKVSLVSYPRKLRIILLQNIHQPIYNIDDYKWLKPLDKFPIAGGYTVEVYGN